MVRFPELKSQFTIKHKLNNRGIVFLFNIACVIIDSGHETETHPVVSFSSPLSTLKSQMPEAVVQNPVRRRIEKRKVPKSLKC